MLDDVMTAGVLMPVETPGYLSTEQAAKLLGVTTGRVRQLIKEKVLPSEKLGHLNMIPIAAVVEYGKNRTKAGWQKGKPRKSS